MTLRRDIQGLRAFAVLVVIAFHAGLPLPGGFVGVDVFFVISGFVITAMLRREWRATGSIRFRRFYARRFLRLTPALAVMVAIVMLLSIPLLSPFGTQQAAAQTGIGAMLLLANVVIARTSGGYFDPAAELNPLLNTWSLSVEEQFYLVFPAVLFLGWWIARRAGRLRGATGVLVLAVAIVSFGAALLNAAGTVGPRTEFLFGFYGPVSRAWEFAVGALLALVVTRVERLPGLLASALAWVGAVGLVASLWLIDEATPFPGPWTLLPVLATAAVIAAGTGHSPVPTRLLSTRPAVAVGDWSYSLYLWHWPVIVFAAVLWPGNELMLVIAAAVSVVPALASYRWVEQPLRGRTLRPPRFAALVGAVVLIPIALALVLWAGANRFWGLGDLSGAAAAQRQWEVVSEECLDLSTTRSVPTRVGAEGCVWNEGGEGVPVYLVGDSAAAQYLAGVRQAANEQDSPLRLIAAAHCPLTTATRVNETTGVDTDRACSEHNEQALDLLTQADPGVVLLATSNRYWYVTDDLFTTAAGPTDTDTDWGRDEIDPAASRAALEDGLRDVVTRLEESGQDVVVVSPTVTFLNGQLATPERMPLFRLLDRESGLSVRRPSLEPGQEAAEQAVARVASSTGADLVDLSDWQCPQDDCPAFMGDVLVYADSAHLSQDASLLLADRFAEVIGPVVTNR